MATTDEQVQALERRVEELERDLAALREYVDTLTERLDERIERTQRSIAQDIDREAREREYRDDDLRREIQNVSRNSRW